jgi:hypothetical protein
MDLSSMEFDAVTIILVVILLIIIAMVGYRSYETRANTGDMVADIVPDTTGPKDEELKA